MRTQQHQLPSVHLGQQRALTSWHFGLGESGQKVYIQASLHADEIPPMLVAHHLKAQLLAAEAQGAIRGEIVLVPIANPIGLAQEIQGAAFGRFDLGSGINFNRGYQYLTPALIDAVQGKLTDQPTDNLKLIRQSALKILDAWQVTSEADALKKCLQTLAIDADIVLDLHCDHQAVVHLYAATPLLARSMPLAAYLDAQAVLVTAESGGDPFDENCSRHWWELAAHFNLSAASLPLGCLSMTVELRGETDVAHELARKDADGIYAFLQQSGHITGAAPAMPAARCVATPLEGVDPIAAPHAGVLIMHKQVGEHVQVGESIGEVLDPLSGLMTPLLSRTSGILFANIARRYVSAGTRVAKVAGHTAFRQGMLLSM